MAFKIDHKTDFQLTKLIIIYFFYTLLSFSAYMSYPTQKFKLTENIITHKKKQSKNTKSKKKQTNTQILPTNHTYTQTKSKIK